MDESPQLWNGVLTVNQNAIVPGSWESVEMSFKAKLYYGYTSILALLLIIAVLVTVNMKKIEQDATWADHTYEVIKTAEKCGALLIDIKAVFVAFSQVMMREFSMFEETLLEKRSVSFKRKSHTKDATTIVGTMMAIILDSSIAYYIVGDVFKTDWR